MFKYIILTAAVIAGGAIIASPVSAKERQPTNQLHCPDFPTTNDLEVSREGGASIQIAGFGVTGNKAKSRSVKDVMMREGGLEAWSGAFIIAAACLQLRDMFPNDYRRQLQEMLELRKNLLEPKKADYPETTTTHIATDQSRTHKQDALPANTIEKVQPNTVAQSLMISAVEVTATGSTEITYDTPDITTTMCAGNACTQTSPKQSSAQSPFLQIVTCLPMVPGFNGQMIAPSFCSTSGSFGTTLQFGSGQTTRFGNW